MCHEYRVSIGFETSQKVSRGGATAQRLSDVASLRLCVKSMLKVPDAREDHRQFMSIRGGDHFVIPN